MLTLRSWCIYIVTESRGCFDGREEEFVIFIALEVRGERNGGKMKKRAHVCLRERVRNEEESTQRNESRKKR